MATGIVAERKKLNRLERREAREAAKASIREARINTLVGFSLSYGAEKLAVNLFPSLTQNPDSPLNAVGGVVDLSLLGLGGWKMLTDDGPLGDYATGAFMVGATQFLDRVVGAVQTYIDSKKQ